MRFDGSWRLCDDGIIRPVFSAAVRAVDGAWVPAIFLADTAADRTVLSEDLFRALGLPAQSSIEHLGGVGGVAPYVLVATAIRLHRETAATVLFSGQFAAFTDPAALDTSVLGRDITNLFALIVDRPQDLVCLLGQGHRYTISGP
jgi:Aspartyl protease